MVHKVQIQLEDDLNGGPADETLTFALDGRDYEIDLSATHAQRPREALRPFITAARRATGRDRHPTRTIRAVHGGAAETAAIRAWARKHGHQVSDRGRIHQTIKDAYYTAH